MDFLERYLPVIIQLYKAHKVKTLYAFGSVLNDRFNNESDIDLIVDFEPMEVLDYSDNYFDLKFALQDGLRALARKPFFNIYPLKKIYFLLLIALTYMNGFSQKNDYIWVGGYKFGTSSGFRMDFHYSPPKITDDLRNLNITFTTNSNICDAEGNLQFFTNGVKIMNNSNELIENGFPFLSGAGCDTFYGCSGSQWVLTLPFPGSSNKYSMIGSHMFNFPPSSIATKPLYYAEVDMSANNGKGALKLPKTTISSDTLAAHLTAVRHGNGRDWWVLAPRSFSNTFYKFLLTPQGLIPKQAQSIGMSNNDLWGEAVFSPDGTMYALNVGDYTDISYIKIFKFDRCTGLLSDSVSIYIPSNHGKYIFTGAGTAISPNSRFLYLTRGDTVFQFDLQRKDIAASKIAVAGWDGNLTLGIIGTYFADLRLAPDGKIYITTPSTSDVLHVIDYPDSLGAACHVRQHAIQLPTYNRSLPNYPFFRLGALRGSPCDTLTPTAEVAEKRKAALYPNPAYGNLSLSLDAPLLREGSLVFYDLTGRETRRYDLAAGTERYAPNIGGLPVGMYFCSLFEGGVWRWSGKLVIKEQ